MGIRYERLYPFHVLSLYFIASRHIQQLVMANKDAFFTLTPLACAIVR